MSSKSSRTDLPETVLVGRVLRPHGLRGELVVEVLSDVDDRLDPGSSLLVTDEAGRPLAAGPADRSGAPAWIEVAGSRPHKAGALVRFAGVADKDGAERLRGVWLAVERSRVPRAPDGTFYHYELLGCRCSDGGRELGEVVDLREDGGGLLLIVEGGGRRVPVPFVGRFIRRIDVASGVIDLDLPPGLIEECASTS
ncbi:MAG TPA: ribosome maturation factor RimM [Thermoanaerobaculia bacterium]|nr:ribosome maturation factor RimM [Thermoanaerobaculia bacterium]